MRKSLAATCLFTLALLGMAVIPSLAQAPPPCTLDLTLLYTGEALNMDFQLGTPDPVTWTTILYFGGGGPIPLWSEPIPVIDPTINLPVPIPGFPQIGTIAILTLLHTPTEVTCFDLEFASTALFPGFDDPNLEAAVREALGIGPTDPLTFSLLQTLTSLDASVRGIQSLDGIEFLSNLTSLDLFRNSITDIAPLAGLTELTFLELGDNAIGDLTSLAGLTQLTTLFLFNTSISDITPLAGLTQLTLLDLGTNSVSDLSPLVGLPQLTGLGLGNNSISDLSLLAGLTQLTILDVERNSIIDLSPLVGFTQLTSLDLDNNSIVNLGPLAGLIQLTRLDLNDNSISDLNPLAGLIQLSDLDLDDNLISDISPLVANAGLGAGDKIELITNLLDSGDCADIQTLIDRGADVNHDVVCP